jgi:hypothetical protein
MLQAQRANEAALSYPRIAELGSAVADLCERLGSPLVWSVGDAAERLLGAATVVSGGGVRPRLWTTAVTGERVLLLCVSAVGASSLIMAAGHARAMGAVEVHASGVDVAGPTHGAHLAAFDSYSVLDAICVPA